MTSLSMTPSIPSTTLLTKQTLPGAFRLEFHNKNDQVIAKLYQGSIKRGTHNLEGVSAKQWEYELPTIRVQDKIKQFLKIHNVPINEDDVIKKETQASRPISEESPHAISSSSTYPSLIDRLFSYLFSFPLFSPSISQDVSYNSELPVGSLSVVAPSPSSTSTPFSSITTLNSAQDNISQVDSLFQQLLDVNIPSLRQSLSPTLDPSLLAVRNSQGYTLFLAAVALGDQAKFEAALPLYKDQGALYAVDLYGRNALHLAAAFGHAALIPQLIDEGFELNTKDQHGLMPLHWAIHGSHLEAMEVFVTSGASLVEPWVTTDGHHYSPLELAIVAGNPAVLDLLLKSDRLGQLDLSEPVQERGTLLHLAIHANQASMLNYLLSPHSEKIKPLLNHKDPQGRTPLQLAAYLGDEYAIYLLFKHGADLHYGTGEKEGTAVHYAALGEQPAAIKLLYNLGAELERTNGRGYTPIMSLEGRNSVAARRCRTVLTSLPRMARIAHTEPPKYAKRLPFNLVLQGGSLRELAYLGALEQMEKLGILKELKRVAGTSAGAITAAFLAVGCTAAELRNHLDHKWKRFLDAIGELEEDLLAATQNTSYQEAVGALLKEYWSGSSSLFHPFKRAEQLKEKLQTLTGLASGEAIRSWIEEIIREKTKEEHCTFKELKALIDKDPQIYKELHVFSLCLTQGKQPQLIRFSHEDPTWDDLIISDAIRASLSIPGVFQPHILHFKDATKTRHPREHHGRFIDGGLLRNDPLIAFDAEKYQEDRYFHGEKTNRRTLGLSLRDETVHTEEELRRVVLNADLVKALVSTFYHAEQILMEETGRYKDRIIAIPVPDVELLDFHVTAETKEKLFTSGREAVGAFFLASSDTRPSPSSKEPTRIAQDQGIPWKYSLFYDFQPRIEQTLEETLRAALSSLYSAKDTLSIFKIKGNQEWEFKLPLDEMYVRLGIIERSEGKIRDQTLNRHSAYLQDERIPTYETIFKPKKELKLDELFEHESLKGKERKRVYIQGAAGSGKSTLCHYIAYRWAKGDLWNTSFKYLFWIPLRNLTKERYPDAKAYTPIDLLIQEYEGEIDLRAFQTCLEQSDVHHQTLIILDGYDELSAAAQGNTTRLANAFKELIDLFPHILITSRPGTCSYTRSCDLELLGFDQKGVDEYIDKFFNQVQAEEKKAKLQQLLKSSPYALSLARIPIHLTLMCSLFYEDSEIFTPPSSLTMTFIYERIVNWLYKWFMLRRIDRGESKQTKERILEEVDLRCNPEIAKIATALEEMAYFAMEEDTLYLERRDIERLRGRVMTSNELIDLGLLRISEGKGYFIHLTFQEFLTASKIANQYLNRKEKSRNQCRDFVRIYKFNPRFALVFYMIAGYLSLSAATSQRYKEALQLFFDDLFAKPHDLAISYELNLLAGCFEECQDPSQITQYSAFIEIVKEYVEYITKLSLLGLDFRLRLTSELLPSIVKVLNTSNAKDHVADVLGQIAQQGGQLPKEALETLIQTLKESEDNAKSAAANALRKIAQQRGDFAREAAEALTQFPLPQQVNSDDKSPATNAPHEVTKQKSPLSKENPEAFIQILKETSSRTNDSAAINTLGEIAQQGGYLAKEALAALIYLLLQPGNAYASSFADDALREVAKQGVYFPKEALEALIGILYQGNTTARIHAANVLGEIAKHGGEIPRGALNVLSTLLIEGDPRGKSTVANALAQIARQGDDFAKEALNVLIPLLDHGDVNTRNSAAKALGEITQQGGYLAKEALEALILSLQQGNDSVKISVANALQEVAQQGGYLPKEALEALILSLQQDNDNVKSSAVSTLREVAKRGVRLPQEALEALSLPLQQGDDNTKNAAVSVLREVAKKGDRLPKETLQALIQLLNKDNYNGKSFAADVIGEVARHGGHLPKETLQALIQLLKEGDYNDKSSAANALGKVAWQGDHLAKEALAALIQFLNQEDSYVNSSAANALEKIARHGGHLPKKALKALIQLLKQGDSYVKITAINALRAIKKNTLLEMSDEAIPLITEICFLFRNSFLIKNKQFQISDHRTIYNSKFTTKLCYDEIKEKLPEVLAKWRQQLDRLNFSSKE